MRVMHVHRIRGIGGSERHLLTLLPALAERGVDPIFVGLDDPAWDATDFYGALQVPAVRIMSPRDFDPLLLVRLARTLRADIVHTHLVHADVYGGLAARLRGTRLVSTKHNDDPFRIGPFRFVERGLSRLTAKSNLRTSSCSSTSIRVKGPSFPPREAEEISEALKEVLNENCNCCLHWLAGTCRL